MINKQFNKLIPYVSENFITYPLFEEGKYIPFLNFWYIQNTNEVARFNIKNFKANNYELIEEHEEFFDTIMNCQIYPKFIETDEGGYEFVKEDWSIEEMVEIVIKLLNL